MAPFESWPARPADVPGGLARATRGREAAVCYDACKRGLRAVVNALWGARSCCPGASRVGDPLRRGTPGRDTVSIGISVAAVPKEVLSFLGHVSGEERDVR